MEEAVLKKIMPHNDEAEQSVIGALILDNSSIEVVENLIAPDDFYQKRYGIIYEAILEINSEGKAVDILTLQDRLKKKELPDEISNLSYVGDLLANVPRTGNAKYYAQIVREKSTLRKLISACEKTENNCYIGKEKLEDIMAETEGDIFRILDQRKDTDFVPIGQIVIDAIDRIKEASKTKNGLTGLPTGFTDLDYILKGLQPGNLVLIAARPAMGKTAFALNIAEYLALKKNESVAIFSLEMSKEELVNRLFAMEARINAQKIRVGDLSDDEWESFSVSSAEIAKSKLILDDTSGISISELRTKCRKYKLDHDIKLVLIDYLQLMSGSSSRRSDNREQEVAEISRSLKALAKELGVPVVALSQLNRGAEVRSDHHPMLSDLRESGSIEQDADVVMFIHREDYYNKDTEKKNIAEIIVAKQRSGPTGTIELAWMPDYTKFENLEKRPKNEGF